jgi:hypothetical protein
VRWTDDSTTRQPVEDLDDQARLPEVECPDHWRQDEVEEECPGQLSPVGEPDERRVAGRVGQHRDEQTGDDGKQRIERDHQ